MRLDPDRMWDRRQGVVPAYAFRPDDFPAAFIRMTLRTPSTERVPIARLLIRRSRRIAARANYIYNQYLFLDNSDENLRQFGTYGP